VLEAITPMSDCDPFRTPDDDLLTPIIQRRGALNVVASFGRYDVRPWRSRKNARHVLTAIWLAKATGKLIVRDRELVVNIRIFQPHQGVQSSCTCHGSPATGIPRKARPVDTAGTVIVRVETADQIWLN
jgi:hypothetical protein